MSGYSLRYEDWLRGWREWARTRKRGKMAQFVVEKLEEGNQAQWLDIERGLFELTEWHTIAKEWFGEKPRNSEEVDAPCMLRKGLPRAFPGLEEVKEKSRKEGTQYRSRVFKAPQALMNDVLLHITNNPGTFLQNGTTDHMPNYSAGYPSYHNNTTGYNVVSTSNPAAPSYFGGSSSSNHLVGATFGNSPTSVHGVEMEIQHPNAHNPEYPPQMVGETHTFITQQGTYTEDDIDRYVRSIAENGVDNGSTSTVTPAAAAGGGAGYPPNTSNGLFNYTPPSSVGGMLGVPSPSTGTYQMKQETGSPPSGPPPYGSSPASVHSPRISPEPTTAASYSPSVQQQTSVLAGPEMSPNTYASPSPAVVPVEQELMKVKLNPGSSPLEGGGQMVLLFYKPLPLGTKMVAFCSQKNRDLAYAQEAFQENMMALICQIPEYPYPEEVELRVYNYNNIIARTTFVFYHRSAQMPPPSDMILQILSSQLQSHFPGGMNGMGGTNGSSNGSADQMGGSGRYGGYIPNSMYQLLLGACRLGCEPLVHCLLSSPVMEELTQEQIKEAYECAAMNGHESLSDLLMELVVLHDMTPTAAPMPQYLSRGMGNSQPEQKHVPAFYAVLDELQQGGDTPQERAETVLKQLLAAMQDYKGRKDIEPQQSIESETQKEPESDTGNMEQEDATTPKIEIITPNVNELTVKMDQASLSPRRRLSSSAKLTRQTNSISDEDDDIRPSETSLKSPVVYHSRESWAEVDDIVTDLVSHKKKHPFTQQSDADSAIGMSFEEEMSSFVSSEVQRRRSSLLLPADMFGQQNDTIVIKLNPDIGIEVANSLEWEGCIVVSEDYPPSQEKKILCKGDKIIQVGEKLVRGMSALEFSELFQAEATSGTTIRILPACTTSTQLQPIESSSMPHQRSLKRTPSEQFIVDTVKTKINQLLSMKSPSAERRVTLPRSTSGFPFKMIGGKIVGVFVSDVRSDLTQQIFQGDEILELNGQSTKGLSLYDVNQIMQTTSGDLSLSVVENRTKFAHIREQVEIDSIYLRSLVDYKPTSSRDMALKKGSIFRVINTCSLPNYWVAWCIDDDTCTETQLKRVMPPLTAKKYFECDAYERVERIDSAFSQPVCVTGPNSDEVAKLIASESHFHMCETFEEILTVCSKGVNHAVISLKDPSNFDLLKALRPIVFQTPLDSSEQKQDLPINSFLAGSSHSDFANHAVKQMHHLKDLPMWKPIGVI